MFRDATSLFERNPTQRNYGVAVADITGNQRLDLIVAGYTGRNLVLRWDGERFVEIDTDAVADPDCQAIGVAAGDVDGDGREEIYVLNTDTFAGRKRFADRLFSQNGDGQWRDLFKSPANESSRALTSGRSVVCLDRTGNGRYGFFVANYGGPMRLYEIDRGGSVQDMAQRAGVDLTTSGRGAVSLPITTDHMDVFCVNENGPNFLFENQGDGTFEESAAEHGLGDPNEHGRGVDAIDIDGALGLVYGNWQGHHRLFASNGSDTFEDVAPTCMTTPSRIRSVIAADFDNDGYQEVFFNNIGEPNRLFGQRDGTWTELDIGDAREPRGLGTGATVADFNGDGCLELVIAHGETGAQPLSLYHTDEHADHHFVRIAPRTQHGAPARGAVVTCHAGGRTQRHNVDAGSGYLCQMEPVAHFGLGREDHIDTVSIHWPDGCTREVSSPSVDELHNIKHP